MRAMSEADLLLAFVRDRDADAFRRLVEGYADVVFATARRQVGSHQAAEDVTQAVFMLLARKVADPRIADDIAQQILEAMHDPFSLHGEEQSIDAHVGIARYPQDGTDIEALRKGCQRPVPAAGPEARYAR